MLLSRLSMEHETEDFSVLLNREGTKKLFETARRVCHLLREAGGRALFVGGCVRDLMLGHPVKDIDIECCGLTPERLLSTLEPHFPLDCVGMSFGILKLRGTEIDIALPRRENKRGQGHRGFLIDVDPALSLSEAAARRDFTINAMLWDPLTGELLDPWCGRADLAAGILRHISEHFTEDPLRVLRAMQFAARFRFSVAPETVALCRTVSLENLARERVAGEWDKLLLLGKAPSCGLHFLADCGWAEYFPGVKEALRNSALYACMDAAAEKREGDEALQRLFMLAVFSYFFSDETTALSFVKSIWNQRELEKRLLPLVRHAGKLTGPLSDGELRHIALEAAFPALLLRLAKVLFGALAGGMQAENEKRMQELGIAETPPTPLILGRDLEALGVPPGKEMGEMLRQIFEAQLDGKFAGRKEALEFLQGVLHRSPDA